jgi:hypothetical protein
MFDLGRISEETKGVPLSVEFADDEARTEVPGSIYPLN